MKNVEMFLGRRYRNEETGDAGGGGDATPDAGTNDSTSDATPASDADATPSDEPAPNWYASAPDDWRAQIAGEDEKRLNDLNRYTTVDDWIKSGFEAKDKIRKGETTTGLPENPSDEQLSAFREANGIPLEGEYGMEIEGIELLEQDQETFKAVMPIAHQLNVPEATLQALTKGMIEARNLQVQRMLDQDGIDKSQAETTLKDAWGADYQRNMQAATNLVNGLPEEVRPLFMEGRDANGRALMSNPAIVNWLAENSLKVNPAVTLPGGGENPHGAANAVIEKVQKMFKDGEEKAYYKDKQLQADYQAALATVKQAS